MPPADDRFANILRTVRAQLPSRTPEWTDANASDPGITIVEVLAYLAEEIGARASSLPARTRADLARVGSRLLTLEASADSVEVRVDGVRWSPVRSLADAGPSDTVYVIDRERGSVQFGDGVHGARPANGASVETTYRTGGGASGRTRVTVTSHWPPE